MKKHTAKFIKPMLISIKTTSYASGDQQESGLKLVLSKITSALTYGT